MTWRPEDWVSLVDGGTTDAERAERVCWCEACQREGQHEPLCQVHAEDVEGQVRCDCGLAARSAA